jgi:hypothetical protein
VRTALAALLLVAACKREAPPTPQKAAAYCDQNLTGVWVNSTDPSFAYRLDDRGSVVDGKFFRRDADGGAAAGAPGDEPMTIELHRTADALSGAMKTTGEAPSGRKCPVEFALRVSSCQPQALQVVAEMQMGVRDDCSRAKEADGGEPKPELVEFRWDKLP